MTKKFLVALATLALAMPISAQKIKGSDTLLPVAQKQAEVFMQTNPAATVSVTGGGSGVGISALEAGTTDIAIASRSIKFDEKIKIKEAGKQLKKIIVAYDALAVIVNPSNGVQQLTREQLEAIFTGKVKNWKEVGGADLKIVAYSRESSSGTYEFFKKSVLKKKNYMASILSMPATGAVVQSVSQTKGAIGYIGLAYLSPNVKALAVSYDAGQTYVTPSFKHAKDQTYPIVRPLYMYYVASSTAKVKGFLDFALSSKGQTIVKEVGYVDVAK